MTNIVESSLGRLAGTMAGGVLAFTGIPYAAPPVPPHRFAAPRPMTPWAGLRDATAFGAQAPQLLFPFLDPALANDPAHAPSRDFHRGVAKPDVPYHEDCLYLNVWTPAVSGKRPVMVWLHGGGFASGSGSWGWWTGEDLAANQDVVVVTLNHRLNILGFLCLEAFGGADAGFATNAGMRDIVMALQWIRDNIAAFGGDPGNVTIFGQSGGGMKVTTLMALPDALGLFHKVIVQSGPFLRAVPRDRADDVAARMLKQLGITPGQLARLQDIPVPALLDAFASVNEGAPGVPRQFAPVVDGTSLPADPFDPAAPSLASGIPMLIGATTDEVTSLACLRDLSLFDLTDEDLAGRVAEHCDISRVQARPLIAIYRGARSATSPSRLFAAIASDRRFGFDSIRQAERQSEQAPVFAYLLSWQSPVQGGRMGAPHNLCLPLVFGRDRAPGVTGTGSAHHALAAKVQIAWASFARNGNPSHPGLPDWKRFDTADRQTMRLDIECRVESDPNRAERLAQAKLAPRL